MIVYPLHWLWYHSTFFRSINSKGHPQFSPWYFHSLITTKISPLLSGVLLKNQNKTPTNRGPVSIFNQLILFKQLSELIFISSNIVSWKINVCRNGINQTQIKTTVMCDRLWDLSIYVIYLGSIISIKKMESNTQTNQNNVCKSVRSC